MGKKRRLVFIEWKRPNQEFTQYSINYSVGWLGENPGVKTITPHVIPDDQGDDGYILVGGTKFIRDDWIIRLVDLPMPE